jgi:hypothetical protein
MATAIGVRIAISSSMMPKIAASASTGLISAPPRSTRTACASPISAHSTSGGTMPT